MACKKAFDKIVIALGGKAGEYKNALAPKGKRARTASLGVLDRMSIKHRPNGLDK